jgi:hypothetical protein
LSRNRRTPDEGVVVHVRPLPVHGFTAASRRATRRSVVHEVRARWRVTFGALPRLAPGHRQRFRTSVRRSIPNISPVAARAPSPSVAELSPVRRGAGALASGFRHPAAQATPQSSVPKTRRKSGGWPRVVPLRPSIEDREEGGDNMPGS